MLNDLGRRFGGGLSSGCSELPPNASGCVDGHTLNGDIVPDFGLTIGGDEDKMVS